MAARRDGWTDLVKLLALYFSIVLPVGGLILYQGSDLRSEIRGLRTEFGGLRDEVSGLRGEFDHLSREFSDLRETVHGLEVTVARIEARDSIRLALTERFSTSGEGASYSGPVIAANILLARALPEIDAALSMLDKDARTELAEDLWEHRATILTRGDPIP